MEEVENFPASSQKRPVSKLVLLRHSHLWQLPRDIKVPVKGILPLPKEGPRKPLSTARGAGKAADTAQAPSPPLRSAPHPPPRRPSETQWAAAAGWPGSSRAEDESRAAQTSARSQSQRATLQGKPPAGPAGHPMSPNVTYCEVTPSRASHPLTSRPQEPGLPPRPFSCRPSKRERAGPQYLGGGTERRPGPAAPKGGGGQ